MTEYVRLFQSAVDPSDVDELRRFFTEDVRPAFEQTEGCLEVCLLISEECNAGGLVEGAALSRWSSREAMETGVASRAVQEALVRAVGMLRQEPLTRVFEVVG